MDLDIHVSDDVGAMIVVDCVEGVDFKGMPRNEDIELLWLLSTDSKAGSSGMAVSMSTLDESGVDRENGPLAEVRGRVVRLCG